MENYIITGSVACGKSSVCEMIRAKKHHVICSDDIVKVLYEPKALGTKRILNLFGKEYLLEDGSVNKEKLSNFVFSNHKELEKLNKEIHPLVIKTILNNLRKNEINFIEVPLYFEAEQYFNFQHRVVTIYVSSDLQFKRLIKRNNMSKEKALKIINSQFDIEYKKENADFIIENNGSKKQLIANVNKFLKEI